MRISNLKLAWAPHFVLLFLQETLLSYCHYRFIVGTLLYAKEQVVEKELRYLQAFFSQYYREYNHSYKERLYSLQVGSNKRGFYRMLLVKAL